VLNMYQRVRLNVDRYARDDAPFGSVGYIIETYEGHKYEVEFSDADTGVTFARLVLDESELVPHPETS